jgi:hypothetical protein
MKRRSFLKNSALAAGTVSLPVSAIGNQFAGVKDKSIFELRHYHIAFGKNKGLLEGYFRQALIPLLNKHNVKVGAFEEYSLEEPASIYTLISYPSPAVFFTVQEALSTDATYLEAAKNYKDIPATAPVYSRFETFLLEAFESMPMLSIPAEKKGLFELRIYESATEDAGSRKIAMFNGEEIALFLKVGLMPVFFGKILAGQFMPALIYMVGFRDMADRDATWKKFGSHEEWNTMRVKPEYADSVSNIRKIFLIPASYSQV